MSWLKDALKLRKKLGSPPELERKEEKSATIEASNPVCHYRAIVNMLTDTKHWISKEDRKRLYLDLYCLIGHRLDREEY